MQKLAFWSSPMRVFSLILATLSAASFAQPAWCDAVAASTGKRIIGATAKVTEVDHDFELLARVDTGAKTCSTRPCACSDR